MKRSLFGAALGIGFGYVAAKAAQRITARQRPADGVIRPRSMTAKMVPFDAHAEYLHELGDMGYFCAN
jgi:hypothetical protein